MRVDEIRILILKFPKFGSVEAILNIAGSGSNSLNGGEPVSISIRVTPKAQTSFSGPAAHPLKRVKNVCNQTRIFNSTYL